MGLKIHDKFKSTLKANVILIKKKAGELILSILGIINLH